MGEEKQSNIAKKLVITLISTVTIVGTAAGVTFYTAKKQPETTEIKNETSNNPVIQTTARKPENQNISLNKVNVSTGNTVERERLGDYFIIGKLEIPDIDLECNILDEVTTRSLEIAVAQMYTVNGLNQPGNTVIYGHNYQNTLFFSRNDELKNGQVFYITDELNNKVKYEIYDIFQTTSTDTSFYVRNAEMTGGLAEATLSTCTDDANETDRRLIIMGREVKEDQ